MMFSYAPLSRLLSVTILMLYAAAATAAPPRQLTHRDSLIMGTLRFKLDVGADYMVPYDASRQIRTVSENIYMGVQFFKPVHLSLYGGITATYAWGNIVQLGNNYQPVTLQTAAFGIGPGVLVRFEPLIVGRFSLSLDVGEALLFYSRYFPAGGDIYNFMSRLGGSICYRIGRKNKIAIGGRWMHVSNAQGYNQHNPSYDNAGGNISVIHYF
jgi:lipid A 3-O-deacylase